jgi:hypothetical protein
MRKTITFFTILLFTGSVLSAQTKTASKMGTRLRLSSQDSMMCNKEWHPITVEEWGVVSPVGDKNKNDVLKLTYDGKFDLILFGNSKSGTWTKAGQYIYFTDQTTKEKFNYKVISVEEKKLKVDYRDPDETHSIFEMEAK